MTLPDALVDLLRRPSPCFVATLMPDGSPQMTQTWVDTDGTHLLINTVDGHQKVRNIRRDPRVAVNVADPEDPARYFEVRGRVVGITEDGARVRGMHRRVRGTDERGRPYSAGDPALLRWVHLAFTDAFLAAQLAVGRDMRRFGPRWPDAYVAEWARSARALGAGDLPTTQAELDDALEACVPELEPVPDDVRSFLSAPPGLGAAERVFYAGLSAAAGLLVSPAVAPFARVPGRAVRGRAEIGQLAVSRWELRAL